MEGHDRIEAAQPLGAAAIMARIEKLAERIESVREAKQAALRDYERQHEREVLLIAEHNQLVAKFNLYEDE